LLFSLVSMVIPYFLLALVAQKLLFLFKYKSIKIYF
jgi:hypothetical protein